MKYSVFIVNERDLKEEVKSWEVIKEEAQPRGWEECHDAEAVQRLVKGLYADGFVLVENTEIGQSGPSGPSSTAAAWGRALYFKKIGEE